MILRHILLFFCSAVIYSCGNYKPMEGVKLSQFNDSGSANFYNLLSTWTHPTITDSISPLNNLRAKESQVAVNANGDAVIVWDQNTSAGQRIFKAEYRAGIWSYPTSEADAISPIGGIATRAQVAMNDNGDTVIVWDQVTTTNRIFKSEYRSGVWTHPASISSAISPVGGLASRAQVVMNDNGDTVIVWDQVTTTNRIFKSEYRLGVWTHPASISSAISPVGGLASRAQVAMNDNGDTVIVWDQVTSTNSIFKSEYRSGVWTHPASISSTISPVGGLASRAQVVMNDNGDTVIVWDQVTTTNRIFKSEYRLGVWTHPASISSAISPVGGLASRAQIAMNDNSEAVIVWDQVTSANSRIYKSEYR